MQLLAFFLPAELAPLLFVIGALALIVGARRIAIGLIGIAAAVIILPSLLEPVFEMLPLWVLALLFFYVGISLFRAVLEALVGRGAMNNALGILVADFIRALFRGLFRFPIRAAGGLFALVRAMFR